MRVYLFWDGLMISKFDYQVKEELFDVGKKILLQGLRDNTSLTQQKDIYRTILTSIANRKRDNKSIWGSDHQLGLGAMMGLIIMKEIEELDDPNFGLFYPPFEKFDDEYKRKKSLNQLRRRRRKRSI